MKAPTPCAGITALAFGNVPAERPNNLFGDADQERTKNRDLVDAYCMRLRELAGFGFVADPLPMRNSRKAVVYYLVFAGSNKTSWRIVQDIYRKYASA
jgi:hypothetical protein